MKISRALLILLASCTVVLATFIAVPYDKSKPPALPLPEAYRVAAAALGPLTNQFHCVSAGIPDYPPPAWLFTFCSTNTPPQHKFVTVEFSGKVYVEDFILR